MLRIAIQCVNAITVSKPNNRITSIGQDAGSPIFENHNTQRHARIPAVASNKTIVKHR
jgi:hypothetical protein